MADIEARERHVTALEQKVGGERIRRSILDQTPRNGDNLAAIRSRLDRIEARLDRHDVRFDGLDSRFDRLEAELRSLRSDLPKIVADTMREVLREHR